jgi:hypothetical protein
MDDYTELDDRPCHVCGHWQTRSARCYELLCEDGWIDEYESDAINYLPGEEYEKCDVCQGKGYLWWCPECKADLNIERGKAS